MSKRTGVYLSIDLDYWQHSEDARHSKRFFKRVWALGLPVMTAVHHHHLLDDINSRVRHLKRIINVDFHSDITECGEDDDLDEGTWVNYVRTSELMTFEWRYPEENCLTTSTGYCHYHINPFEVYCTDWRRVVKKRGTARIPWVDVCAVGVCLSPGWLSDPQTVNYAVAQLGLYEWFGRWSFCNDSKAPADMEKGRGIFRPRLTFPNTNVDLSNGKRVKQSKKKPKKSTRNMK